MAEYMLLVLSDAKDARDAEFNDWYDQRHLPDVLAVDGIVAAQRFELKSGGKWRYCAIYEIDSDDPEAVVAELQSRAGTEVMPLSDAFDLESYYMAIAEPIGARGTA